MEQIFGLILAIIFGAVFGSYATLFAYRLPRGESCFGRYFGKKSRCPQCDSIIKTRDLIPLFNWIFTLGRCRSCQIKIPRIHLFVELATTTLFVLCYLKFSFSEEFIICAMISVGLIILLACDFTHRIFPQAILNFILMVSVTNRALHDQAIVMIIFSAVIGVICAVIFYQIFYKIISGFFTQAQSFDYIKFILIAAVTFEIPSFLFYFFVVMAILTMLTLFKIPHKKHRVGFGYVVVFPFIWLMFNSPIFS